MFAPLIEAQRDYDMQLFDSLSQKVRRVLANSPIGISTSMIMERQGGMAEMRRIGPDAFAELLEGLLERQRILTEMGKGLLTTDSP